MIKTDQLRSKRIDGFIEDELGFLGWNLQLLLFPLDYVLM